MRQNIIPDQPSQFRIKLFGTPSLSWEKYPFSLSRKQARALIYVLGSTLQQVSRDRLIFLFWPDTPEITARRNLSRVLSYIRKTLPHSEIIQLNKESIALNQELTWSDAVHFTSLAQLDTPKGQEAMVALYDGPFLSGFDLPHNPEFDSWLTIQQGNYEGGYLAALKDLIQTKSTDQDYAAAIDFAQRYLVIDELAEDIHQELIRLYAANGDRSAAMRQFETCALILERELGVEPLPETRWVYDQAKLGKISSQADHKTNPSWTVLPSLDLPLIGRQEPWNALEQAYHKFQNGGVILLSGEPGIGKSRLLQEFATSRDRLVLSGNCHASTKTLSYQPITQALRQALSQPGLWAGTRPIWLTETSRLLPDLADTFPDLPPPVEVEPDQAQTRLYEALTQCVLGLARNTTLLLCFDDLQWMDKATAGWLTYLASRLVGSRICILAAYRVEEKKSVDDLQETISRINLLAEIPLVGLTQEAIESLLEGIPVPPSHRGNLAARIYSATGGNTFFVLETIRNLLENNLLSAPISELPLADTVQEAIHRRLERLSPIGWQVLDAAAVISPDLDFRLLQETAGRSELEVAEGLDELARHQLMTNDNGYRFRHDLIHQVTYLKLNPWRRQLLHRRAAETLVESNQLQRDDILPQIARHYDAGREVEKAVHYYYEASVLARRLYAHDEAIIYLEKAIDLSSEITSEWREIVHYYELLGESLKITGQFEASRLAYRACLDLIPECEHILQAQFHTKLADIFENLNLLDQAEETYDNALMLLNEHPDDQTLAWQQAWLEVHLERLGMLYLQAKPEVMDAVCDEIKPVLDKAGTPDQHARYYASQVSIALRRERFALSGQTLSLTEAELKAVMETGDTARIATAKFQWGFRLLWSGNLDGAVQPLFESLNIAEETGRVMLQCRCLIYLTCLHRLQGDVDSARTYAVRSLEGAQYLNSVAYIGAAYGNLAWLDWRDQQFDQAERQAQKALSVWGETQYPFKGLGHWVLLAIYLDREQFDQAIESAIILLDSKQQRLPNDLTAVLEQGLLNWDKNHLDIAKDALNKAVKLAQKRGYL